MLTQAMNDRITRVSPGTPMGELMRRYWHPIAGTDELDERPTKPVRLLGEDLVLYKDRSGTYGLLDKLCPHRRVDLSYGIPEENGLRCMYHGWMFDETGQCIEQPFEETVHPDGRFKEKVKTTAYPVENRFGMLWAYMGPLPAPILPIWEPYTYDNGMATVGIIELPCNWLQCQENSLDPVHLEWLHGYWGEVQMAAAKRKTGEAKELVPIIPKHHRKIGFSEFDNGIIKRRVAGESATEDDADWQVGHPAIFPNILYVGDMVKCNFQYRVPVDDHTTLHVTWFFYKSAPGVQQPKQEKISSWRVPLFDSDGALIPDLVNHQDFVAWITQGVLADRSLEKLGESDRGIIMFRKQLREQMDIVTDGGDPMNVFRDAEAASYIELPLERWPGLQGAERFTTYISPQADEPPDQVAQIQMVLDSWAQQASV